MINLIKARGKVPIKFNVSVRDNKTYTSIIKKLIKEQENSSCLKAMIHFMGLNVI